MRTGTIITGLIAFTGGIAAGLLLTPKSGRENRKWISKQTQDTKTWIGDKSHKILEGSEKRIDRVSKGIKKTVEENVPDLYSATEGLYFSDHDEKES